MHTHTHTRKHAPPLQVDPLRGIAKGKPEVGAFRCYPTTYTPPRGTAPDGVVWADERARNARWGESCVSYYQLTVEYFTSSLGGTLLSILARDYMWSRELSSTPMLDAEVREGATHDTAAHAIHAHTHNPHTHPHARRRCRRVTACQSASALSHRGPTPLPPPHPRCWIAAHAAQSPSRRWVTP